MGMKRWFAIILKMWGEIWMVRGESKKSGDGRTLENGRCSTAETERLYGKGMSKRGRGLNRNLDIRDRSSHILYEGKRYKSDHIED